MALKEQDIVLTTKDASGNTVIQMPITRIENVEGGVKSINGLTADSTGAVTLNLSAYENKVTSVMGKTGAVTGLVTSVNGTSPDANGNVKVSTSTTIFMPNYKAGVSKSWNTNITAETDGEVIANSYSGAYDTIRVVVNNVTLPFNEIAHNGRMGVTFFVARGDVYKVYGGNGDGSGVITFYPLRGANQ